jgi:signal transduction histidine kinase
MIKQMERKFTIVAIAVVSIVLLVLIIFVNLISMRENIHRADNSLDKLVEIPYDVKRDSKLGEAIPEDVFNADYKDKGHDKELNRSFVVVLDNNLDLISTNASLKYIEEDNISFEMALQAVEDGQEYGFVEDYRYIKIQEANQIRVVFLDYSFERQAELNFIFVSIGAYFTAILLVVVLVIILLKPVMKPIKESYVKQRQFITDASHELKTPLTIISTDMELIEMENGPSDWIKSVNNQVERLNALTNELVTLSRMNEEEIQIEMGEVNLSDIVNDVVMGFEPAIAAKGKNFEVNIEENITIKGNYDSLERVMSILLSNALKYSDEHGIVRVDLSQKGKKVNLSVMNSVDYIEKGNHDEFFNRFYRSDLSRNSKTGGFGIGLAVAKSTIQEHRGKIEVWSSDEKSIEIVITLKA